MIKKKRRYAARTAEEMMYDYYRVCCAVPPVTVGDPQANAAAITQKIKQAAQAQADLVLFPELAVTGYTCADLFFQQTLLEQSRLALQRIVQAAGESDICCAVGAPLMIDGALYSCGIMIGGGKICGIVPKTFLPNYNEFYEQRWFSSSELLPVGYTCAPKDLGLPGETPIPVGRDLVFDLNGAVRVGLELCEDLWSVLPPSTFASLQGAELILNLSASNETIAKRAYRRDLVLQQSARTIGAYAYVSAGGLESTTDLVFSGHCLIAENGEMLGETSELIANEELLCRDIDLGKIRADRCKLKTFSNSVQVYGKQQPYRRISIAHLAPVRADGTMRNLNKLPFVPSSKKDRLQRCMDIFQMQVAGLKKRLEVTGCRPVIGVSGGLDSTLALLVCVKAVQELGRKSDNVVGITMPCFGTSDRTHDNAQKLMETLGVEQHEINIRAACEQHFSDIGHDMSKLDGTYENSQARERTQVLMDYASRVGGFVVGTGDLSELALGWCTYNGDQMSMYGVNVSIPKTLVRWMIDSLMEYRVFENSSDVLRDILDTPISPELLPPDAQGEIAQMTESIIGPYALHDFFLYHVLRYGFSPRKIFVLAQRAFSQDFDDHTIRKWLKSFYRRFFSQQFKRSCMPDGVKVGSICLSPRGDWRMPSDASAQAWLREVDEL